MSLFSAPVEGAYHLLGALTAVLPPVVAIIVLTVGTRLALVPLSIRAARAEKARAALAPRVEKLRRRWKADPQRLLQETSALYRREGVSMTGGLLPMLAQAPFAWVVYRVFTATVIAGQANALLVHTFLTVPLGQSWIAVLGTAGVFSPASALFLVLFGLLAVIAWVNARSVPHPLMRLLPFGTVVFAAFVPLAAAVYLVVSGAWTTAERAVTRRVILTT
ncbi:YidC/Oxa1 family membrane protein insertase [Actinocorallia longicatena]|uniref:Membrane protein insertase YidC n=1 Tax=Actinocorallia longicatena TaxID=111803 RepID=A0ABP6QBJ0_9ACTN